MCLRFSASQQNRPHGKKYLYLGVVLLHQLLIFAPELGNWPIAGYQFFAHPEGAFFGKLGYDHLFVLVQNYTAVNPPYPADQMTQYAYILEAVENVCCQGARFCAKGGYTR